MHYTKTFLDERRIEILAIDESRVHAAYRIAWKVDGCIDVSAMRQPGQAIWTDYRWEDLPKPVQDKAQEGLTEYLHVPSEKLDDHRDPQTTKELATIRHMVQAAAKQGLLVEVVWSFGHGMTSSGGLVKRAVAEALYEWDI